MNFLIGLLNPLNTGYIYGTSVAIIGTDFKKGLKERPFLTLFKFGLCSSFFSFLTNIILSPYGRNVPVSLSGFLLGLSIYNIYNVTNKNIQYQEQSEIEQSEIEQSEIEQSEIEQSEIEQSEKEQSEIEQSKIENESFDMEKVD